MERDPPDAVKSLLRKEVGFGCPVPGCGCPYLEWHHFDPPWRDTQHHDPGGMIALCRGHHIQADNHAFTVTQLRGLKRHPHDQNVVRGRFEWMRQELIAVVGGNLYQDCSVIFRWKDEPMIWFRRDGDGYLLLNLTMPSSDGSRRAGITDNNWFNAGLADDIEAPPSARSVRIRHEGGESLTIEFSEVKDADRLEKRYSNIPREYWGAKIKFPITAVEVTCRVPKLNIDFGPRMTELDEMEMRGCVTRGADCAIDLS